MKSGCGRSQSASRGPSTVLGYDDNRSQALWKLSRELGSTGGHSGSRRKPDDSGGDVVGKPIFPTSNILLADVAPPPTCAVHVWTGAGGTITAFAAVLAAVPAASRPRTRGWLFTVPAAVAALRRSFRRTSMTVQPIHVSPLFTTWAIARVSPAAMCLKSLRSLGRWSPWFWNPTDHGT